MMHKNDINYLQCRDNIYYFVRRVPKDIHKHYSSQRISLSLKTKSKRVAEHKCRVSLVGHVHGLTEKILKIIGILIRYKLEN